MLFKLNQHLHIQPSILAVSLVSLVVMMGSTMIFDVPAGFLADKLGLTRTMILGLGILIGASTLAGLAGNDWPVNV